MFKNKSNHNQQGENIMIRQTILPFKLEMTRDIITPHAGLALMGEFAVGLKLLKSVDSYLPKPKSGAGYKPSEYIFPLILTLNGGGRSLEDTRQIKDDEGLREVLPLKRIPSADAIGDWMRRIGHNGGLKGLEKLNREIIKQGMKYDGIKSYTLDIDATGIVAEKESAKMTYKGFRGYMPIVGHITENGLALGDEFREGNDAPAARNLEFIKHCKRQMPKDKKIKALRADSAAYQADIINYCERRGIKFAIGADLDEAVLKTIRAIPDKGWSSYKSGYIAETIHSMSKTKGIYSGTSPQRDEVLPMCIAYLAERATKNLFVLHFLLNSTFLLCYLFGHGKSHGYTADLPKPELT